MNEVAVLEYWARPGGAGARVRVASEAHLQLGLPRVKRGHFRGIAQQKGRQNMRGAESFLTTRVVCPQAIHIDGPLQLARGVGVAGRPHTGRRRGGKTGAKLALARWL